MDNGFNSRLTGALLSVFMVLFVIAYSVYMGVRYFYSPYQTETAYYYTIADSFHTRAVAVRQEKLIPSTFVGEKLLSYQKENGDVIISGSVIAHAFEDEASLTFQKLMSDYDEEIELLLEAQSVSKSLLADTAKAQVNNAVGVVVQKAAQKDLDDLDDARRRLHLLLGKYRISTGRDENYSQRIESLSKQRDEAASRLSENYDVIKSSVGGYFCAETDGFEEVLTPDFSAISFDDYRRIINGTATASTQSPVPIGKVQLGHNWYLAFLVERDEINRFEKGAMVSLDFGIDGCSQVEASVSDIISGEGEEQDSSLIVLKTSIINSQLIALRQADIDIRFKSYTGLRVDMQALRYEGLIEGVYVKNGNLISFKPIKRLYTGENFVLCAPLEFGDAETAQMQKMVTETEPLKQFDEVVIKGVELYDGKII